MSEERPPSLIDGKRNPAYDAWYRQSNQGKIARKRYSQSVKGKECCKRYGKTEKGRAAHSRSREKAIANNPSEYADKMVNHLKAVGAYDDYKKDYDFTGGDFYEL